MTIASQASAQEPVGASSAGVTRSETTTSRRPRERAWTAADAGFVLTAERITGLVAWHSKSDSESEFGRFERERSGTQLNAFAATGAVGDGEDGVSFSGVPRLAFDFVLPMGLSLGVLAGVTTSSGDEELTIDGSDQPRIQFPNTTTVILGGRVGYLLALSEKVALWPRIGATYNSLIARGAAGSQQTIHATQLLIDPALVLTPVPHVGISLYPIIDIGLGGSINSSFTVSDLPTHRSEGSFRTTSYGGAFGLSALF